MAQSALSVLMLEELSSDSIPKASDSGIDKAFMKVHEATQEAKMRVSRLFHASDK
jgi:hypothetical protein